MSHPTPRGPVTPGSPDSPGPADAVDGTERRLRAALTETALGVRPSAVPLAAIERNGRRRVRRHRAAVMGGAAAVLLLPLAAVLALHPDASDGPAERVTPPAATVAPYPSPSSSSSAPAGRVRVVAPGERVTAAPGTQVWLTEEGKHWTTPDSPEPQFRSAVDGNIDLASPDVTVQQEGSSDGGLFLSGIYVGRGMAARVAVETTWGTTLEGTALRLPGNTTWGVWYASAKVPDSASGSDASGSGAEQVTVYDAEGGVLAESVPLSP